MALGIGATIGLVVAMPVLIAEALKPEELRNAVGRTDQDRGEWDQPDERHARRAARARIDQIEAARTGNTTKARILRWGMRCAIAGIVSLLVAVIGAAIAAT